MKYYIINRLQLNSPKWNSTILSLTRRILFYSSINRSSAPLHAVPRPDYALSSFYNFSLGWKCPEWVVIHSPALCRLMWLPGCAAIRRLSLSPSLFVLVLCRRLCSSFPLLHTRNVTHTLSPLVVLECVLVGQRLHNTELWVPSHVFVHHDDTQASAPAEMTEEGTKVVQKSSSPVHRHDSSSAQWLQHFV